MTVRRILAALAGLMLLLGLAAVQRPPLPSGDFVGALRAWDWWRAGGSFHHVPLPPLSDLAARPEAPLVWWSPGSYLPVTLAEWSGGTLAGGIALWLALGTWLGLWGWAKIWSELGHDDATVAIALILVTFSWHTLHGFRVFNGGEITRFAALPWLWLFLRTAPAGSWRQAGRLALVIWAAAALKLTLLISVMGVGFACVWDAPRRWPAATRLAVGGTLALVVVYSFWLMKGLSPGSGHPLPDVASAVRRAAMAITLPAGAVFAQTSVAGRLGDALLSATRPENNLPWLLAMIALAAVVYTAAWRASPTPTARRALLAVCGVTIVALAVLLGRGAAVSFEDRHARDAALLLVPALVGFARQGHRLTRVLVSAALVGSAGWGLASLALAWASPASPLGARGLPSWEVPGPVTIRLNEICRTAPPGEAVVFTPHSEISLQAPSARVFPPPSRENEVPGQVPCLVLAAADPATLPPAHVFSGFASATWQEEIVAGWTIRHMNAP